MCGGAVFFIMKFRPALLPLLHLPSGIQHGGDCIRRL